MQHTRKFTFHMLYIFRSDCELADIMAVFTFVAGIRFGNACALSHEFEAWVLLVHAAHHTFDPVVSLGFGSWLLEAREVLPFSTVISFSLFHFLLHQQGL